MLSTHKRAFASQALISCIEQLSLANWSESCIHRLSWTWRVAIHKIQISNIGQISDLQRRDSQKRRSVCSWHRRPQLEKWFLIVKRLWIWPCKPTIPRILNTQIFLACPDDWSLSRESIIFSLMRFSTFSTDYLYFLMFSVWLSFDSFRYSLICSSESIQFQYQILHVEIFQETKPIYSFSAFDQIWQSFDSVTLICPDTDRMPDFSTADQARWLQIKQRQNNPVVPVPIPALLDDTTKKHFQWLTGNLNIMRTNISDTPEPESVSRSSVHWCLEPEIREISSWPQYLSNDRKVSPK